MKTAKAGRYEIKVEELRVATAEDKHQLPENLSFERRSGYKMGRWTPKGKASKSITKRWSYIEEQVTAMGRLAQLEWARSTDHWTICRKRWRNITRLCRSDGRLATAVEKLETLNNIGTVYRSLGEGRKALDKFNEARIDLPGSG